MPTQRSGFGAKTAKSIGSTSAGKQNVADRGAGADSVIRAIAGSDIGTWLDASDIDATDGAALASWTAKEGNAPVQTDDATPKQPTLDVNGLNGRPAVKFDGANDCLQWAAGALNASDIAANTIVSTSVSTTGQSAFNTIFELGSNSTVTKGIGQAYNGSGKLWGTIGNGPDTIVNSTKASFAPNVNNVIATTHDRTTNPDTFAGYVNGGQITNDYASGPANTTGGSAWSTLISNLGARANGGSLPLNGHIREFLVLNRAITAGEAFRLGRALMAKSGLTKLLSGYS